MEQQPISESGYLRYHSGQWERIEGSIIREAPVVLSVNGEEWLTLLCTPSDLEALAVGFLYNEGSIESLDEVASASVCARGDLVDVWLTHALSKPATWRRTSGCSGGLTAAREVLPGAVCDPGEGLTAEQVTGLIERLLGAQELYRLAGGVHTSILSDGETTLACSEDIGRHNTLDKIAGRILLDRIQAKRRILVTTGRISSEMLQKAARLGASVLISRTSPNALSVEMARARGITLIGYARRDQFQVYAHPERIQGAPWQEAAPEESFAYPPEALSPGEAGAASPPPELATLPAGKKNHTT